MLGLARIAEAVFDKLISVLHPRAANRRYWEKRARRFGARAVLNLGHPAEQLDEVTDRQKAVLFPPLKAMLRESDRIVLDFGCGPGRFTHELSGLVRGGAIGVDPIRRFIDLAQKSDSVEYRLLDDGKIPLAASAVDVVWICLVLGGVVRQDALQAAIREIDRVLKPGGLLYIAENTSDNADSEYWVYRSVAHYQTAFREIGVELGFVASYQDLGEEISIMAGRKPAAALHYPGDQYGSE